MAPSKKRKRNDEWEPNHLLTNASSKLGVVNLSKVLGQPEAWNGLAPEEQASLLALAPSSLVESPNDGSASRIRVEHPEFRHALLVFQGDLTEGRLNPRWLTQSAEAMEARGRGEFDQYHEEQRMLMFGESSDEGDGDEDVSVHGIATSTADVPVASPDQATSPRGQFDSPIDPVLFDNHPGRPYYHNPFTSVHEDGEAPVFLNESVQTSREPSLDPNAKELSSKLKLDVLVRAGWIVIGDVFILHFKRSGENGEIVDATKEATIRFVEKRGYLSFSYPPGINATSPAADGRPDLHVRNITGPTHLAAAMLKGDDGQPMFQGGSWKDFTVRRGGELYGTLWDIRQAYHGGRRTADHQTLPGVVAPRRRRVPQKLKEMGYRFTHGVFEHVDPVTKEVTLADASMMDPDVDLPPV